MDFHQLRVFAHVFRLNSFTKASAKLHISQPTISEHIKNLECEYNCKLFDRLGRRIFPTPRAERLYPKVIEILDQLNSLKSEFCAAENCVRGELLIGASTVPGTYILPKVLSMFRKKFPETTFEIQINDTGAITEKVLCHDLLYGIVGSKKDEENLDFSPLVQDKLVLVASADFSSGTITATEFHQLPLIVREQGSGTRDTMIHLLKEKGVNFDKLHIAATLGSSASVKEAVRAGLGASFLSRMAVEDELDDGKLVELDLEGCSLLRHFFVITHKKRSLPLHYQKFNEFLLGQLA